MIRTLSLVRTAALGLLALLPTLGASADATLLRLQLQPGEVYRYGMSQEQQLEMDMGALGSQKTVSRSRMELRYVVGAVAEDGAATLDTSLVRMRIETDSPNGVMIVDTAEPPAGEEENPMAGLLRAMTGKTIQVVLSPRGEVLDVGGFDQVWQAMTGLVGDDPTLQQMFEALKEGFGPEMLRQSTQQSIPIFPQEPVNPGSRWSQNSSMDNGLMGSISTASTYEVRGTAVRAERDCLELATQVALSFDNEFPLLDQMREMFEQQGLKVDIDLKVRDTAGQGSMWLERKSGMVVETTSTMTMTLDMAMNIVQGEQSQQLPMSMKIDMKIGLLLLEGPTAPAASPAP